MLNISNHKDMQLKLVLEGKEFTGNTMPIKRIDIVNAPGTVPHAILDLVPTDIVLRRRTMAYVFCSTENEDNRPVWRLLFKGEITGRGHEKMALYNQKPIYLTMAINYMNDMPAMYARMLNKESTGYNVGHPVIEEDYKFYRLPRDKAIDLLHGTSDPGSAYDITMNLTRYMARYFNHTIGEEGFDKYYKDANRRFRIVDSHVYIDSGRFNHLYKTNIIEQAVKNIRNRIETADQRMLDDMMGYLNALGYLYIALNFPTYSKELKDEEKTDAENRVSVVQKNNVLKEYVMLPDLMSSPPPRCNVIFVNKNDNMTVNIRENTLTRLKNNYRWAAPTYDGDNILAVDYPLATAYYPRFLKEDPKMYDEEYDTGVIAAIQNKDAVNAILSVTDVFNDPNDTEENKKNDLQGFIDKYTAVDFYHLKYSQNTCNVSRIGYNPYVVPGLPCLIVDTESNTFYYGKVERVAWSINTEGGNTTTTINASHIREIRSTVEICRDRDRDGKYSREHSIIHPLSPSFFDPFDASGTTYTTTENGLTRISKDIYYHMLGSDTQETGWKSILDIPPEITDNEEKAMYKENILNHILSMKSKEEQYCRRYIATEKDTIKVLTGEREDDNYAWTLFDERLKLKDLSEKTSSEKEGKILVDERRRVVDLYYERIRNRLLR